MWAWLGEETNNAVTLVGYVLVAIGTGLAAWQWGKEQRDRRAEEAAKRRQSILARVSSFDDTPGARNAMLMLSGYDRNVPLYDAERPEDRYERVAWRETARALIPADIVPYNYDPKEDAIRNS